MGSIVMRHEEVLHNMQKIVIETERRRIIEKGMFANKPRGVS